MLKFPHSKHKHKQTLKTAIVNTVMCVFQVSSFSLEQLRKIDFPQEGGGWWLTVEAELTINHFVIFHTPVAAAVGCLH